MSKLANPFCYFNSSPEVIRLVVMMYVRYPLRLRNVEDLPYPAAMRDLGNLGRRAMGRWKNNRVENSHLRFRRRERAMLRFRQMKTLQKFASVHASVHNHFNQERHLVDRQTYQTRRSAALAEWQSLSA